MEIDHIFIRVQPGAPEASLLQHIGLVAGSANQHVGQGTANQRFFFDNFCLELLFIDDPLACQNDKTRPLQLYQRLQRDNAVAPFGIGFRPSLDDVSPLPFATWHYQPDYLPEPLVIEVAPVDLREPMWFYLAFAARPDASTPRQPLQHACGIRQLTHATLYSPLSVPQFSDAALWVQRLSLLTIKTAKQYCLELVFDEHQQGITHDFRPQLPLVIGY